MDWRVKGIVQKILSAVPGGRALNTYLQTRLGDLRHFDENVRIKVVEDWSVLVMHMKRAGVLPSGLDYVEVGSGWYPTLPLCYALGGARSCRTYDLHRHLNARLTFRMLEALRAHLPFIAAVAEQPLETVRTRYETMCQAQTVEALLATARVRYIAPGDASKTGLDDGSVDVVYSNSVLEHVPRPVIEALMLEARRILRPGGLAIHSANCGDHYAYFDRNITAMNYLRYSEAEWRLWNNGLLFQNRLRPVDFRQTVERAGLRVVAYSAQVRPELLQQLPCFPTAEAFLNYEPRELASTSVDVVAVK